MPTLKEPELDQVLAFCAEDPVERVFLEDVARRGLGRFFAVADGADKLTSLCHAGANIVPSGRGSGVYAPVAAEARSPMIIGDAEAVTEPWEPARDLLPAARADRPK